MYVLDVQAMARGALRPKVWSSFLVVCVVIRKNGPLQGMGEILLLRSHISNNNNNKIPWIFNTNCFEEMKSFFSKTIKWMLYIWCCINDGLESNHCNSVVWNRARVKCKVKSPSLLADCIDHPLSHRPLRSFIFGRSNIAGFLFVAQSWIRIA